MIVRQNIDLLALAGVKLDSALTDSLRRVFSIVASPADSIEAVRAMLPPMKALHPDTEDAQLDALIAPMMTPWYRAFMRLDPAEYMVNISCPVLALNGSWDDQVNAEANLGALAAAIPHAEVKELPGLNHLFQEVPSRAAAMNYGAVNQTISPEVLSIIARYILKR